MAYFSQFYHDLSLIILKSRDFGCQFWKILISPDFLLLPIFLIHAPLWKVQNVQHDIKCDVSYTKISILHYRCSIRGWRLKSVMNGMLDLNWKHVKNLEIKRGTKLLTSKIMSHQNVMLLLCSNKWFCSGIGT